MRSLCLAAVLLIGCATTEVTQTYGAPPGGQPQLVSCRVSAESFVRVVEVEGCQRGVKVAHSSLSDTFGSAIAAVVGYVVGLF